MFIWFAAGSVAIVWAVFQSPAIDYRMVMLGSVLGVVEVGFRIAPLHTLAAPTIVLIVVGVATIGHRLVRRQLLGIPIGMFLHLVLDGAWTRTDVFWWPAAGWWLPRERSLVISRGIWSVLLELLGIGLAVWLFDRFGLEDRDRRRRFLSSGQLDRRYLRDGDGPAAGGSINAPPNSEADR